MPVFLVIKIRKTRARRLCRQTRVSLGSDVMSKSDYDEAQKHNGSPNCEREHFLPEVIAEANVIIIFHVILGWSIHNFSIVKGQGSEILTQKN